MAESRQRTEARAGPNPPRVSFVTLGCRVNQSETAAMRSRLQGPTDESLLADVVVVNGCTVTALADRKSRQLVRRAKRRHPEAKVVLIGCLGDAVGAGLADAVDADLVVGNAWKGRIEEVVELALRGTRGTLPDPGDGAPFEGTPPRAAVLPHRSRGFLKVQDGCDGVCAYCRTTQVRGATRSRPLASAVSEARQQVAAGIREIVVVGVDLAAYRTADGGLAQLIAALGEIAGLHRLRFGSLNPAGITDEWIDAVARSAIVCGHLHIPLQSGDDTVLARMLRPYRRADYLAAIDRIRDALPEMTFGTDLIVGFPGESEEAFGHTLDAVEAVGFVNTHIFRYSPRRGTRAASFADDIPPSVKHRRASQIEQRAAELRTRVHQSLVGTRQEVLLEREAAGRWRGYTAGYVRARILPSEGLHRGRIVAVQIASADAHGIEGAVDHE